MVDWSRWLPGLEPDPEEQDPVTKTLGLLGQGASAASSAIGQGVSDVGSALGSAATTVGSYLPDLSQPAAPRTPESFAPEDPSSQTIFPAGTPEPPGSQQGASLGSVASDVGSTVASEGIATPIGRGIANLTTRPLLGKPPLEDTGQPETSIDRALVETGRSLGSNLGAVQSGDPVQAALGVLGTVGDLAPSTLAARQLNEMVPKIPTPFESVPEVGLGDIVMTAAMLHDLGRLGIAGYRVGQRLTGEAATAIRGALGANAENVAAADARMAAEGGTTLPGTLGVITDNPLEASRATRTRIVPPEVADTLDFPIRPPTDPTHIRAIEAAGGTVDERGVTLPKNVRAQGPEAAGETATRGGPFYEVGERSSYLTGADDPYAVGGTEQIGPAPTRYRNPLVLGQAPGESAGFDQGMAQIKQLDPEAIRHARERVNSLTRDAQDIDAAMTEKARRGLPTDDMQAFYTEVQQQAADAVDEVKRLQKGAPTADEVGLAISRARRAGPGGSPERAQALRDLVSRYGGDPTLVDDLLAIRGADAPESTWAIKENILHHNARAAGHDGVLVVQTPNAPAYEIMQHPNVIAAKAARDAEYVKLQQAVARGATGAERAAVDTSYYAAQDALEAAKEAAHRELFPSIISEHVDLREATNPTPTQRLPEWQAASAKVDRARDDIAHISDVADHMDRYGSDAEIREVMREFSRRQAVYQAAVDEREALRSAAPGYTLREDVKPRAQREAEAASEAAWQALQDQAAAHPDVQAAAQRARAADEAVRAARSAGDAAALSAAQAERTAAYGEHARLQAQALRDLQAGSTDAAATAGILPPQRIGADRFGGVNRVLGQGVASTISGSIGAQVNEQMNPDDPNARLKGFLAAGLGPLAATHGIRAGLRAAGRLGEDVGGGALGAFGVAPGAGGAPTGIGARISAAYQQRKAANVATMQAAGITPPGALKLAGQIPGAISHAALLGPGTATIGMMSGLIDAAKAPLKEPLRAGVRAFQTGNPAAWREAGETFKGAAAAFYGHEHVGQQLWDLIRGRGRYASSPDRPRLAEQISEPILRQLVGALEVPGRVWSGAPDALFGTIGRKGAQFREAAQMATDRGLTGGAWDQETQRILGDYEQATRAGTPLSADAQRLEGVGTRASERAGYQEQLGRVGKVGRQIATLGDAPVIGQFVSPYYNTPWNQFIRAGENLPTGALMGRAGDPRLPSSAPGGGGRHAFDRYADATLGSALVAGAIGYGMQGKITGSGPEDPDERRMLRATGWRPYSYLAGDTYLPNRSAGQYEPILNAIGESADWMKYRKKDADPRMVGEDAFRRIGTLLSQSPAASGLKTIMDVVDYGPAALASDVATRLTPGAALARSVGQAGDPYERTTDRGKGVGFWDEVGQRWQLATGQRQDLPIQQDPAGRTVPNPREGLAAFFPQVGTRKDDPLIGAFTEAGISLGGPPPTVEGVQLTPEQRRRYHTLFGEMLEQTAGPLVRSEGWASIPVAQRKTLLEQMSKVARDTAAARTQGEGGEQYWRDYTNAKLEKAGVAP